MKFKPRVNIKKLISVLLCTILVSSTLHPNSLNGMVFAANSNNIATADQIQPLTKYKNKQDNKEHASTRNYAQYVSTFAELQDAFNNSIDGDCIILNADIAIPKDASTTNSAFLSCSQEKNITIDGNGHTINPEPDLLCNGPIFSVINGATLNLNNVVIDCSTFTKNPSPMGVIYVNNQSTLNINSGTIITNLNSNDSLIKSDNSNINLNANSSIRNCNSNSNEGTICLKNNSKLQFNNGAIDSCSSINGGAIYAHKSTIELNCGKISNCSAHYGNAIYLDGDTKLEISNDNPFEINVASDAKGIDNCESLYGYPGIYDVNQPDIVSNDDTNADESDFLLWGGGTGSTDIDIAPETTTNDPPGVMHAPRIGHVNKSKEETIANKSDIPILRNTAKLGATSNYFKIGISVDDGPVSPYFNQTQPATLKYIYKKNVKIYVNYTSSTGNQLKMGYSIDNTPPDKLSNSDLGDIPDADGKITKKPPALDIAYSEDTVPAYYTYLALMSSSGSILQQIRTPGFIPFKDSVINDKNPTYVKSTNKDKDISVTFHLNTVKEIKNNEQTLTTTNYKTINDNIILKKDYLSNLNTGQHKLKISVWPRGKTNLDDSLLKNLPEYTTTLHVANFNNLNSEYTYGDNPNTCVSLDYGNATGATFSSSDKNVATIDNEGKLEIVGAGTFTVKATINGLTFESDTITVKQKEVTLENVKIKDKEWNGELDAKFDGEPKLKDLLDEDKDKIFLKGEPKFTSAGPGNVPIDFSGLSLIGDKSSNYKLIKPDNIKANILPKPPKISDISTGDYKAGSWTNKDVTISCTVEKGSSSIKDIQISLDGNEWNSLSDVNKIDKINQSGKATVDFTIPEEGEHNVQIRVFDEDDNYYESDAISVKIDTTPPEGNIKIYGDPLDMSSENEHFSFFTFEIYPPENMVPCKQEIQATDDMSGIESLTYFSSNKFYQNLEDIPDDEWKDSDVKISNDDHTATLEKIINVGDTSRVEFVYAKITDKAGNTTFLHSDGYILYKSSKITPKEITHVKLNEDYKELSVTLNGNTIDRVVNTNTDYTLKLGKDYKVVDNNKIVLLPEYLNSLDANTYELRIWFNPAGKTNTGLDQNLLWGTILSDTITLDIKKSEQNKDNASWNNLKEEYTYGETPGIISLNGGSGNGNVTYKSSDESVATIDKNGQITIVGVGEFEITATKAADKDYEELKVPSGNITVHPKELEIKNISAKDKEYDGNTNADYEIFFTDKGNVKDGDEVSVNIESATFADKNVGDNKVVTFSGFTLSGNDSKKYKISNKTITSTANITHKEVTISNVKIQEKHFDKTDKANFKDDPKLEGLLDEDKDNVFLTGSPKFSNIGPGNDIDINFDDLKLDGTSCSNYELIKPKNIKANILDPISPQISNISTEPYVAGSWTKEDVTLSCTIEKGSLPIKDIKISLDGNEWNSLSDVNKIEEINQSGKATVDFTITEEGEHNVKIRVFDEDDNYYESDAISVKIDKTKPEGHIKINGKLLDQSSEDAIFSLISRGNGYTLEIDVEDNTHEIKKLEYFTSKEFCKNLENLPDNKWVDSDVKIYNDGHKASVHKFIWGGGSRIEFAYAKITDNANNITIIRSDGYILYTDSEITTKEITHFKPKENYEELSVTLNGNTVAQIVNKTNNNQLLTKGEDYTVKGNKIVLNHEYLNSLDANTYSLAISFNPARQTNLAEGLTLPEDTVSLDIKKSEQQSPPDDAKFNNLQETYTYGYTPAPISLNGSNESDNVTYESDNPKVATIDNDGQITIVGVGSFTITATKAADENYEELKVTSDEITVNPLPVKITGVTASDKVYDGNNDAKIDTTNYKIEPLENNNNLQNHLQSIINDDKLSIICGSASFSDEKAAPGKTVTFTGFELNGAKKDNYFLSEQPANTTATIEQKELILKNVKMQEKHFDKTDKAAFDETPPLEGVVTGDDVFLKGSPKCASKYPNTDIDIDFSSQATIDKDIRIDFSGLSLGGNQSSNYYLTTPDIYVKILEPIPPKINGPTLTKGNNEPYNAGDWTNKDVTLSCTVEKGSLPIKDIKISLDENKWNSLSDVNKINEINQSGKATVDFPITEEGTHNVKIRVFDEDNNYSDSDPISVKIDKTKPKGHIKVNGKSLDKSSDDKIFSLIVTHNGNGPAEIQNTVTTDSLSGIKSFEYCTSRDFYPNPKNIPNNQWKTSDNLKITDNTVATDFTLMLYWKGVSGYNFVYAKATDKANNVTYLRSDGIIVYIPCTITPKTITHVKTDTKNKELSVTLNENTIASVVNATNNEPLTKGEDYTVEGNKIILLPKYLNSLYANTYSLEISFYPAGQTNLAKGLTLPTKTVNLDVKKSEQNQNNVSWNNLKEEYTYGDTPSPISLNGGKGSGDVTYSSTHPDVAEIDPITGELTIKKVGEFQIIATKEADEDYEERTFESGTIKVHPKRLTIDNIKIKDKFYDGTNKAEFDGEPTLTGIINGDDVKLIGNPKFSSINVGENILIDFSDLLLNGHSSANYYLIPPDNIYGNILPVYDYKEDKIPINKNNVKLNFGMGSNYDQNFYSIDYDDSIQSDSDETTTDDDDQDEIFDAEDSRTGIQVYAPKGVFPKWSRLVVREMYPNTNEYDNAYKNLDENIKRKIEHIRLYEVYVVNQDGEVIQPNISKGLVTVRIPIPNDYDLADLQIYRIKQDADDNFDTNIVNINNKNYCEFQTSHFSPYTMIDEKTINDIILSILPYLILLLILILISLFILILTKKKKDEDKHQEEQQ